MENPKVSVVMPIYNGEKYLKEAVDSILNQTFKDFELILINDGSTDSSKEIIESYKDPRIVFLNNEKNIKLVATLNRGLETAKGEYIARMDCDDVAKPERLEKQVEFMDSHPEVGLCGTWFELSSTHEVIKHPTTHDEIMIKMLSDTAFAHPTVVMRKSVLDIKKIKYDPFYIQGEDYGLWITLSRVTKTANVPESLLIYRVHETQLTQKYVEDFRYYNALNRLKQINELGLNPTEREKEVHISLITKQALDYRLQDINSWISKLIEANEKIKFFNRILFEDTVSEDWNFQLVNTKMYRPSNLVAFFTSKAKKYYGKLSLGFQVKFLFKSLISWNKIKKAINH